MNLQIALVALGLATVIGIYLYSRFRDRSITNARSLADQESDPSVSSEYENMSGPYITDEEYQSYPDIPDYLTGIDSGAAHLENGFESPQQEPNFVSPGANHDSASTEPEPPEYQQHQPILGVESNTDDEDEPEAPVLVEQIDLEEMVDDAVEETTTDRQSEDAGYPDISDSPTELTEEVESGISAGPAYEEDYAEAEDSNELLTDTGESGDREINLSPKPKFNGFGIFNRFRRFGSDPDFQQGNEPQFEFENGDEFDNPDTVSLMGEHDESETLHGSIHENLEEITVTRFEYPEIHGFNRLGQIDYWVRFHGGGDIDKETLEAQYEDLFNTLGKPTRLHGIRTSDQAWINVLGSNRGARFVTLIVSLQLVDSAGAITRNELNRFTSMVTQFSERMGKDITFMAPLESALEQATALSEYVKLFDSPSMVLVVPEKEDYSIHGREIDLCASQLGLEAYKTNYYVRTKIIQKNKMLLYGVANMSDEGTFDFQNMENLHSPGLVFFFRPLFHQAPGSVLSEMVSTAKSFAGRIGAKAITPEGEELTVAMTAKIRADIEKQSREMTVCGLKSGSDTILRVFESEIFASE